MQPRLDALAVAPDAIKAVVAMATYVKGTGLEGSLLELVKIRASQINGCAYCIEMHTREAREAGETEERIYLLSAWRESSFYTQRERAALAWTEALTLIAETHAPDDVYDALKPHFTPQETVNLTLAIGAINLFNRLAIGLRTAHPVRQQIAA